MLWGRRNKRDEFERAVESVFPSVYSTARRLTRNDADAEDLSQEALVRAYEAYDRFDGRNLKAWLLRIVTNLYINRYRREKRGPDIGSVEDNPVAENVVAEEGDPDRELFEDLLDEHVEAALQSLTEEYRSAVVLADVEGMSYEEIAEALGVPIGTVRSRLARGRTILRKKLESYAREEGYIT